MVKGCILSKFYIKPQLPGSRIHVRRVVSYRNSTSNHNRKRITMEHLDVVSYRNSTSNHNVMLYNCARILVVSYRNSTSNHNILVEKSIYLRLYLIEILHQTTTQTGTLIATAELYLIEILHQTTTKANSFN